MSFEFLPGQCARIRSLPDPLSRTALQDSQLDAYIRSLDQLGSKVSLHFDDAAAA